MHRWTLAVMVTGLVAGAAARSPESIVNPDGRASETFQAESSRAMVASASAQASAVGVEVMQAGGNAVDAAVAVSFAVSVLRPQSTGLGGGGFMLVHWAESGRTEALDFRETAPRRAERDMYVQEGVVQPEWSRVGHLAAAVPGLVAGLSEAHQEWGVLSWTRVVEPAIRLAEEGFDVYPELARRLGRAADRLARNEAARAIFFRGGTALAEGDRLVQSDLAATLRRIAADGRAGFDQGEVAGAIAEDMAAHHGLITSQDLREYAVVRREPIQGRFRGYEIVSMPPPSSGGVHLVQMLNVLEGYDLSGAGVRSADAVHWMIEAMRQAYADRSALLGDPDFVDVPVERLTSKAYAEETRRRIPPDRPRASVDVRPALAGPREGATTTHISVVDPRGNAVSTTQTINGSFGAFVVASGTGILLNNEMDDFSAQPGAPNLHGLLGGEANAIASGKRPLSSMTPTLVLRHGKVVLVLGSPGGSRIITAVLQVLLNVLEYDEDLLTAVARPRFHHQWMPDRVDVEPGAIPPGAAAELTARGHLLAPTDFPMGEVQAVRILPDGRLVGVSDPRRSGRPAGW